MSDERLCRSPLTDTEVTALADGALEALSPAALEHAETCASCAARVADEALLALEVGHALTSLATTPAAAVAPTARPARAPVPSPTKPILIALAVATLASLPTVPSLGRSGLALLANGDVYREAAWQALPSLVAVLNAPAVMFVVATGLIAFGAMVARFSNRPAHPEGALK